nr:glutamate racemase [Caldichromatium japonicum]
MSDALFSSSPNADAPIGVFDSGVGGLTVLREIRRLLPAEDLLYVADSAYAPYGDKPSAVIAARALAITEFLLGQGAKAIVVACNTATGAAVQLLRAHYPIPVIAMEPAIKPAVERTRSGVIGVLATRRTLESPNLAQLVERFAGQSKILLQPCPGLVERIESGDLDGPATCALLEDYLEPLLAHCADTLVLGCTHYPLLRPVIQALAGPQILILDSGAAVARQVQRRLSESGILAPAGRVGRELFWTSANPGQVRPLIAWIWGDAFELGQWEAGAQLESRWIGSGLALEIPS